MKKNLLLFFLGMLFCTAQVMAQNKKITGKVVAEEDSYALPGVSVKIKGTNIGVQTDANGLYTISAATGQTLVFSFVGTATQERVVGAANTINVSLKQDAKTLNEVTITTGFGVSQRQRDLTSPVQTVKGAAIQQTQRENFLNALQGRVAGATVTSTSGNPGASSSIVLRGVNSIGGSNSPLFVIDGVRISNDAVDQTLLTSNGANRSADFTNRIADLNPDDIETVTVLKGADAAAVYGSSASGGAIVITTRKGHSGNGAVTYDNNFSFANAYLFPKVQNMFGIGTNGNTSTAVRTAFGPAYAPGTPTFNNLKNSTQTGHVVQNNVAFEGGDTITTYRISASFRDATGVLPVAYNNKTSIRFAGTSKLSSKLQSSATFNYFNVDNRKLNKGATGTFLNALAWPTFDNVRNYQNADGSKRLILPLTSAGGIADDYDNPLWDAHNNISSDKTNRVVGTIDLSYNVTNWLNIRSLMGIDYAGTQGNNFISQNSLATQNSALNGFASTSGLTAGGIIDNYADNNLQLNGSLFITAKKSFKDFRATFALGTEAISNSDDLNGFYGEKFIQPDFNSINNTTPTTQRSSDYLRRTRYLSGIARLNLVYKEMIIVNATAREEYSSRLSGTAQDHYFYPSVGAGFIFTELPFLKDNPILSYGKLRASYAEVGKDPAQPYKIFSTLLQQTTTGGGFAYDVTGNNPRLRPERDKEIDLGAELQFFKGRFNADISYYQYIATNQIFNPRISYGSGYILEYLNGGEVRNHGVEIALTGSPVKTKSFSWDIFLNFDAKRGKVVNLGGLPEYYNSDTWLYNNTRSSVFPGASTLNIASYNYAKNNAGQVLVDPSTGLPINNLTFGVVGDRQPKFSIGLGNHFAYKNFDLNFLFDIRKGGDVFNGNELFLTKYGLSARTTNRLTPITVPGVLKDGKENTATPTVNTIQVTPYYQNTYYTSAIDADFIEHNINWVRLKDITLSYRLPQKLLARQKVFKFASVFVTATDVFLITNYSGADPDVNGTNSSTLGSGAAGYDYGVLPTPRVISMGLRVRL
ncbi:SusC/RagA family TonB-linked outer membrane protein [Mucilaginibacter sp.]|uniref:SusC/RagA family TonB-linked outer membrane protein n=1 Tax=Mucilaginibacter sp. TaxID=1882438 RepID=UPI003AFFCC74